VNENFTSYNACTRGEGPSVLIRYCLLSNPFGHGILYAPYNRLGPMLTQRIFCSIHCQIPEQQRIPLCEQSMSTAGCCCEGRTGRTLRGFTLNSPPSASGKKVSPPSSTSLRYMSTVAILWPWVPIQCSPSLSRGNQSM